MFYYINGTLVTLTGDFAVLDCGGVGYKLGVSASGCSKLSGNVGKKVLLYTYFAVREDSCELFGFCDEDELMLFKKLISVSGVGPKGAMSVLSTLPPDSLRSAVASGDAKAISRAQGIGSKTAQKIIIELKGTIGLADETAFAESETASGEVLSQVTDTLLIYGFSRGQINQALKQVNRSLPMEEIMAETLRILGKEGRL